MSQPKFVVSTDPLSEDERKMLDRQTEALNTAQPPAQGEGQKERKLDPYQQSLNDAADHILKMYNSEENQIIAARLIGQGLCDTTMTPRFENKNCVCPTYEGNLGPCSQPLQGANGRCVYCDHLFECHAPGARPIPTPKPVESEPLTAKERVLKAWPHSYESRAGWIWSHAPNESPRCLGKSWEAAAARLAPVAPATDEPLTTMLGRTKTEWLIHLEELFDMARPGEDIPQSALLYAWPGKLTEEDFSWAREQLAKIEPKPVEREPLTAKESARERVLQVYPDAQFRPNNGNGLCYINDGDSGICLSGYYPNERSAWEDAAARLAPTGARGEVKMSIERGGTMKQESPYQQSLDDEVNRILKMYTPEETAKIADRLVGQSLATLQHRDHTLIQQLETNCTKLRLACRECDEIHIADEATIFTLTAKVQKLESEAEFSAATNTRCCDGWPECTHILAVWEKVRPFLLHKEAMKGNPNED